MRVVRAVEQRSSRSRRARRPRARSVSAPEDVPPRPSPIPLALQASVLVLNRLYMAIHVVGARRAFVLLFREVAEVIHHEDGTFGNHDFDSWRNYSELRAACKQPHEDWIRAVNFEIQVPRVIRLLSYDRMPRQKLQLNRHSVLARDEHRCQYCSRQFPPHRLSLDHVVPRSRGGMTTWENVVCACLECNVKKGGRTPREARMKLVRRPIRPNRNPMLIRKLASPKYETWRSWLDGAHWEIAAGE
ncbi:MAG TPA: HNH endonuclease [Thermoguttaceae bacterium]|nr:HNH endonuclease [Thermoguttaceae bacterium]